MIPLVLITNQEEIEKKKMEVKVKEEEEKEEKEKKEEKEEEKKEEDEEKEKYKSSKYSKNSQDLSRLNFDEEVVKVRRAFVVSGLVESKVEEDFQDASIRRRCSCNYETSLLESSLKIRRRKRN
ncbi:hypothetical protein HZH68_015583 [Vespula germanica]|uniref:Uncharacterized protein n=1 Tax=Vespula germanica TaxID=30212 RepID=A0A834MRA1_VESGE|nr:hypothetical protein HZH68_015583 [Vespula germanica]